MVRAVLLSKELELPVTVDDWQPVCEALRSSGLLDDPRWFHQ